MFKNIFCIQVILMDCVRKVFKYRKENWLDISMGVQNRGKKA